MVGLDTNILIRFLVQDDPVQSAIVNRLIEEDLSAKNLGFVSIVTLVEISWVLESVYKQNKNDVLDIIHGLLITKELLIDRSDLAYLALKRCTKPKAEFSDSLIAVISEDSGCAQTFTFDKGAQCVGMTLLK
jgi:predicted nucleic-acid-binding protein